MTRETELLAQDPIDPLPPWFAEAPAEELLRRALERWPQRLVLASSLQAESLVILDMVSRLDHGQRLGALRLVTLDTGRLPEETYDLMERVRERYGLDFEVYGPDPQALADLVARRGPNLFRKSPSDRRACCQVRKVEPLRRALAGADAWISGLRRDQSASRHHAQKLETDPKHRGLFKLNPLVDWTWDRVWEYVRQHDVPYHAFYDQGYTSIGCAPCTRSIRPWEDHRAGRWWWEQDGEAKECGLHWSAPSTSNGPLPIHQPMHRENEP